MQNFLLLNNIAWIKLIVLPKKILKLKNRRFYSAIKNYFRHKNKKGEKVDTTCSILADKWVTI